MTGALKRSAVRAIGLGCVCASFASLILAGCSRSEEGAATSEATVVRYLYEWREAADKAWVAYEVSSQEGRSRVLEWIQAYKSELDFGADLRPKLALVGRGNDLFVEFGADGTSHEYTFLYRYPPVTSAMDYNKWKENLSEESVAELRAVFMEHGVQREMSIQETCADSYLYTWTSDGKAMAYDVSSPEGRVGVRDWMRTHSDAMRGVDGSQVDSTQGGDILVECFSGESPVVYCLPETLGAITDLRSLFGKHGELSDPDYGRWVLAETRDEGRGSARAKGRKSVSVGGCGKPARQTPPVSNEGVASPWLEHLEDLIERLAISQEDAKFPSDFGESKVQSSLLPPEETAETKAEQRARIDAAHAAVWEIRACGRAAWGRLLEQVGDRRKSVCLRSALPCTVGGACYNIVEDQLLPWPTGYRGSIVRRGGDGDLHTRPSHSRRELYGGEGLAGWLKAREDRTLTEIHIEAIEWLIAEEKKIGFPNEESKESCLYPLERRLSELRAKAEQRLSVVEATRRIESQYGEPTGEHRAGQRAVEWGGDEVWRRLHAQVFKIGMQGYLIWGDQVRRLGYSFGGDGLESVCVSDLDHDGNPELLYTYSWGSGLHRSRVGAWCPAWPEPKTILSPVAHSDSPVFTLDRRNDQDVAVRLGETIAGKLVLKTVDGKPRLDLVLESGLPQAIRDEMWIVPREPSESKEDAEPAE